MKASTSPNGGTDRKTFTSACLGSCKALVARLSRVRDSLLDEARQTLRVQDQMLRLALNEAEALAWETRFPQLVFADLAAEKIDALATWNRHQRDVDQKSRIAAI